MSAIVLSRNEQAEIHLFAKALVEAGWFRSSGIAGEAHAAVAMVAGREIGLGPVEAIRSFHFTSRGVEPSAELLARLVRRHPRYDYRVVELTEAACELEFTDGGEFAGRSRFSVTDQERAELTGDNWQRYPRNMLFARAMTNGVGWYAPDVIDALVGVGAVVDDDADVGVPEIASAEIAPVTVVEAEEASSQSSPEPVAGASSHLPEAADEDTATASEPEVESTRGSASGISSLESRPLPATERAVDVDPSTAAGEASSVTRSSQDDSSDGVEPADPRAAIEWARLSELAAEVGRTPLELVNAATGFEFADGNVLELEAELIGNVIATVIRARQEVAP